MISYIKIDEKITDSIVDMNIKEYTSELMSIVSFNYDFNVDKVEEKIVFISKYIEFMISFNLISSNMNKGIKDLLFDEIILNIFKSSQLSIEYMSYFDVLFIKIIILCEEDESLVKRIIDISNNFYLNLNDRLQLHQREEYEGNHLINEKINLLIDFLYSTLITKSSSELNDSINTSKSTDDVLLMIDKSNQYINNIFKLKCFNIYNKFAIKILSIVDINDIISYIDTIFIKNSMEKIDNMFILLRLLSLSKEYKAQIANILFKQFPNFFKSISKSTLEQYNNLHTVESIPNQNIINDYFANIQLIHSYVYDLSNITNSELIGKFVNIISESIDLVDNYYQIYTYLLINNSIENYRHIFVYLLNIHDIREFEYQLTISLLSFMCNSFNNALNIYEAKKIINKVIELFGSKSYETYTIQTTYNNIKQYNITNGEIILLPSHCVKLSSSNILPLDYYPSIIISYLKECKDYNLSKNSIYPYISNVICDFKYKNINLINCKLDLLQCSILLSITNNTFDALSCVINHNIIEYSLSKLVSKNIITIKKPENEDSISAMLCNDNIQLENYDFRVNYFLNNNYVKEPKFVNVTNKESIEKINRNNNQYEYDSKRRDTLIDCYIVKIVKLKKQITLSSIINILYSDYNLSNIDSIISCRLEELLKKGFLKQEKGIIVY